MGISSDEDSDPEYDINEDEDFWDDMDEDKVRNWSIWRVDYVELLA